jgi:hypothetical protein
MWKYKGRKQKFHSLGAAAVDDEDDTEELDLDDLDLEGEESEGSEEEELDEEEPEDEEESEDDDGLEGEEEEEEPRSTRANERIRRLSKERKELEARNLAQQRELDRLRTQSLQNEQQAQHHASAEAQQAWLNSLKPEDRTLAILRIQQNQHAHDVSMLKFNLADSADKAQFDTAAATNPLYRKLAAKVEAKLLDLRKNQNLNAPRMEILKHMVGEMVLKKGKGVTKKAAKDSKTKHTVKSSNGKGDIGAAKRKGSSPAERLAGVKF